MDDWTLYSIYVIPTMCVLGATHGMQVITDAKGKDEALEALVEHLIPGRNKQYHSTSAIIVCCPGCIRTCLVSQLAKGPFPPWELRLVIPRV